MDSSLTPEVAEDIFPYLRIYKDGTIERLIGTEVAPAGFDSRTGVTSKDVVIARETGLSVRIYRPYNPSGGREKLPIVIYFHGGAYIISSTSDPKYHDSLNRLVAEANVLLVSVDYRRAPENPLPAAYDDSRTAIRWVASHASGGTATPEAWLCGEDVDFKRVFLSGDSAGANISHHMAIEAGPDHTIDKMKLDGIIMIFPYFWGEEPIGLEVNDPVRRAMVDNWWRFVCPSDKGNNDPLINPFADGEASRRRLAKLGCDRVIVCVAEKDILRDRGKMYYEELIKSSNGWRGSAEMVEIEGEDHVFHIVYPESEKAAKMIKSIADFINHK